MGRRRQIYSLYRRTYKLKNGKTRRIWYYHCYNEHGERQQGVSTGFTNRHDAEDYVLKLYRDGELVPLKEKRLSVYARDFWKWGACSYCKGKLARSAPGKPKISERHANDMRRAFEQHVEPVFGQKYLSHIRPRDIEEWLQSLSDKGLSGKRINNISGSLSVILKEAQRLGDIRTNPFDAVQQYSNGGAERGIFTIEEVQKLFAADALDKIWAGNRLHYIVSEVAAATGMRMGEILALRAEDIHADHIHVAHSWHSKYGLQPTKTRQERDVPLPDKVRVDLQWFIDVNADGPGFLFRYPGEERPAANAPLTKGLYAALRNIGVSAAERKKRNLVFHSWRHWWASLCQARGIPQVLTQRVTGHATTAMVDHYTTFKLSDYKPVAKLQAEVFNDAS